MTETRISDVCLNCGAPLQGRFCAECGQRAVPAYPTVSEIWLRLLETYGRPDS